MNKPEYFPTQMSLYVKLKDLRKDFDINKSLAMSRYSFSNTKGKQYLNYSFNDFINDFNKTFGSTIDPANSQICGAQSALVAFYDIQPESSIVEGSEKEAEVVIENVSETSAETPESILEGEEFLPYTDIDWERVEAFKGSKEDKLDFDKYAARFGVSLKRNKSIKNMLADFKEAVGVNNIEE